MLYKKTHMLLLLLATAWLSGIRAQELRFRHLTAEQGLSRNSVLAITQDQRGYMWFGTAAGLNRYDGHRFRTWQEMEGDSSSLLGNSVISLLPGADGKLWVGTSQGLNRFDPAREAFQRIKGIDGLYQQVNCLIEDRKGNLWIGGRSGLFILRNQSDNKVSRLQVDGIPQGSRSMNVRSLLEDRKGNIWLGTDSGLVQLQIMGESYRVERFYHQTENPNSLSGNYISSLAEDSLGRIWVGTQNAGLNLYEPASGVFRRYLHQPGDKKGIINNNIRCLMVEPNGILWIGTQEGISQLDPRTGSIRSHQHEALQAQSLSQNSVYSFHRDRQGNIWVGTYFGGVNQLYARNTPFTVVRNDGTESGLNNNVISSILEDDQHNLWIGTEGGGLNYYDRRKGSFTAFKFRPGDPRSLASNLVKMVYRDKGGRIWAGTHGGGLNELDPVTKKFTRHLYRENDPGTLLSEVIAMQEDHLGRYWIGTTYGMLLMEKNAAGLEPVRSSFTDKAPFGQVARCFLPDSRKRLWIGSLDGIYVLQEEVLKKVSNLNASCLLENRNGEVWAGINQAGLARFDEQTGTFNPVGDLAGTAQKNILGLLEDQQGNFWLSTDNGLVKYYPETGQWQVFTQSDGLAGNAFNNNSYFRDSRGKMFFGGYQGITCFYPDSIETNLKASPLVLTGLRLFNHPVFTGDSLGILPASIGQLKEMELKHGMNIFSIEFALLNYIKSNKNRYHYKLEGFDADWVETSQPMASFSNLAPGSYQLLVKAANNDGIWSDPVTLKIRILPPFWRTWWAYAVYVLLAGGVIFLQLRYFFLRALFRKEEELHQVKLNFFTNISHEIRTHLTLIMAPVEKLVESGEPNTPLLQQLGTVRRNAQRLLRLVNELMDFRKAESGHLNLQVSRQDLVPFLEDIYNSFRDLAIQKTIQTSFVSETEKLEMDFDRAQLEKVFFNLLVNAYKFTPPDGRVSMHVKTHKTFVEISVVDNGRGIAPEYLDKLFNNFFQVADHGVQNTGYGIGLALSKNIVELHQGKISVDSRPAAENGEGYTCFTVQLPRQIGDKGEEDAESGRSAGFEQPAFTRTGSRPLELETESASTILVVDDNPELRQLIGETFTGAYRVIVAGDGGSGLERAQTLVPDLVISDVMMPGMDGFELCSRLKLDERTSHIPVILLTAKSTQSDQVSGLETGADIYLTKPFSTKVLELTVRNLLTSREKLRGKIQQELQRIPAAGVLEGDNHPSPELVKVDREFLEKVISLVEEHLDHPDFGVEMLSRKVAMSPPVLYRKLKALTNMSVNDFVKSIRLRKAAELLRQGHLTIYEVAYAVGFNDRKYFSQEFKKQFGVTPSAFPPSTPSPPSPPSPSDTH